MARKTTIYLPDALKAAVEREAKRLGWSEAEVIRQAVAAAVHSPTPNAGIIDGEPLAERVDELLTGFGDR
jgi:predicted transcriptional regulator